MNKTKEIECFINGIQYTCRTCFDPAKTIYGLEDQCNDSKTWRDLLNDVAQLKTNNEDLLPNTVCCKCLDKIISYYDFITQIRNVNEKYTQLLTNNYDNPQDSVTVKYNNFRDCLAESAIALPSEQYVSDVKFEEELYVPYDIATNKNRAHGHNSENEGVYDPIKETVNEDIKFTIEELQDEQRSLNEEINQLFKDENTDNRNDKSSASSDESDDMIEEIANENETNSNSHQFDRKKYDEVIKARKASNSFTCNICQKPFSTLGSLRRHIKNIHHNKTNLINESGFLSSSESDSGLTISQRFEKKIKRKPHYYKIEKINNHFICPVCKKTFSLKRNCHRHLNRLHSQRKMFSCGFCGHHANCKEYLTLHIKRMHPGESFYSNINQIVLSFGKRLYSKPARFCLIECKLCDTTFVTSKELRLHLANHSDLSTLNGLELNSDIVQHWFSDKSDLNVVKEIICKDIRERHWNKYYTVLNEFCFEISVSDTEEEDLQEETTERINKYDCELCEKEFSYKYQVFAHVREDHDKEEISLKCSHCKLEFVSIKMYEQHRQTHCRNAYKNLLCAYCPGKFIWLENMKNHNCVTKIPSTESQNYYTINGSEFGVPSKIHKFEKLSSTTIIRCGLCELFFEKLRDLRRHMPLHSDGKTAIDFKNSIYVKQFECLESTDYTELQQQIKNAFSKRQISRLYQAIDKYGNEIDISDSDSDSFDENTEDKKVTTNYMCELCKKTFRKRKHLFSHQQEQHNDVSMPFTCKDCKSQYVSINLLQQHLKRDCWNEYRRIGEQCDYCNKRFIWPNSMLIHKQIQHHITSKNNLREDRSLSQLKNMNSTKALLAESSVSTPQVLNAAKAQHRIADVQLRYCFLCPKTFFNVDHFKDHLIRHQLSPSALKSVESMVHSTWWPNGKKTLRCKICDLLFTSMVKLKEHLSPENPKNLCAKDHSLSNYSITNQKGFELHLELDSETEIENDEETRKNDENKLLYSYSCCMCNRSFKRKYQIAQHQRSMHNYELLEHKCERCFFRTVSQKVLDYHRDTQCFNTEKKFQCNQCSFKFMWQENLDNHISIFHTGKGFAKIIDTNSTTIINETLENSNNKTNVECLELENKHIHTVSEKKESNSIDCMQSSSKTKNLLSGSIYSASSSRIGTLAVPTERHKNEKFFKCNFCETTFARTADLVEHKRQHNGERPFKCTICEKSFKREVLLRAHKRSHIGERPYKCTICQKSFTKPGYLKLHIRIHSAEKPYKCNVCGKSFKNGAYLKKHREINEHNDLRSTPDNNSGLTYCNQSAKNKTLCPMCGISLSSKTNLKFHIRIHTGEKPYKCDLCELTCARKFDLRIHRRTHFTDRPFKCTLCEKSFVKPYKLKVHMRMHTGERPYQCTICQKKFNRTDYLRLHMFNHTGEKPFRCEICDQGFKCLAYLKKHRILNGHDVDDN